MNIEAASYLLYIYTVPSVISSSIYGTRNLFFGVLISYPKKRINYFYCFRRWYIFVGGRPFYNRNLLLCFLRLLN